MSDDLRSAPSAADAQAVPGSAEATAAQAPDALAPEPAEPDRDPASLAPGALWDGDAGALPRDTRRAIVRLVQGPYLSAERQPDLWNALMSDEAVVQRHLADMFLALVIDRETGLAFVRNADDPTGAAPSVVRTMPLTFIDTALLLHLRTLLLRVPAAGQRAFVDREELLDHLRVYRPRTSTDESGFDKRVSASVSKMLKASLLRETSVGERYEISPILALVFGPDEVAAVAREYRRMLGDDAGAEGPAAAGAGAEGSDPDDADGAADPDEEDQ
ncbi:DUF4194 domain-containing protein [Actinomyces slackii]|uniref:DUF4194 domain-containing protein n=1 Tax=Actinomyces slackii TaxID=52774 RepID=A0A3S4WJ46_9ACTO|nr:DUF4194 domain-containing protein [Actinomyces slackii]VEG74048.1 Uncharacterised protein [Actinomyces slackii]